MGKYLEPKPKNPGLEYYDRKVTRTQTTGVVAMGGIIPDSWKAVRIYITKRQRNGVDLQIIRLIGDYKPAQIMEDNKNDKQDT